MLTTSDLMLMSNTLQLGLLYFQGLVSKAVRAIQHLALGVLCVCKREREGDRETECENTCGYLRSPEENFQTPLELESRVLMAC